MKNWPSGQCPFDTPGKLCRVIFPSDVTAMIKTSTVSVTFPIKKGTIGHVFGKHASYIIVRVFYDGSGQKWYDLPIFDPLSVDKEIDDLDWNCLEIAK